MTAVGQVGDVRQPVTGVRRRLADGVPLLFPLAAVILAVLSAGVLLALVGTDPVAALRNAFGASLGGTYALSTTIVKALPRLLAALGIALALRAGLWNIGAEGQLYLGAVGATAVTLWLPGLPGALVIALAIAAGAAAGAAWAVVPGVLRAYRGISEVITSLMLVYVGIQLASYLIQGPWSVPGATFPATAPLPPGLRLPIILGGTVLNAGVLVALVAALIAAALMDRTVFGLDLRATGGNPRAARTMGVDTTRTIVVAMIASGAFAGLAGVVEVLGTRGRLILGFSPGYGFEAIAIALLGGLRPGGVVAAALLFGALDAGGAGLQASGAGVSAAIVQLTGALAVVYLLAGLGVSSWRARRAAARRALEQAEREHPAEPAPAVAPAHRPSGEGVR